MRSYFACNLFIFLEEDFALPLIQLLLLIFSKRLDNLLSACGALDFIFSFGFVGLVFTGSMPSDLLPSPFSLLYFSISSRIVFFNTEKQLYRGALWKRCSWARNFIKKETLAQVFSCELCKISKNTFSYRTPLAAASKYILHLFSTCFPFTFLLLSDRNC